MQTENKYPCVLSIAGSDSSGGAGIQADIKAISAVGCYAASVITALTAQNTQTITAIAAVDPVFIQQQIDTVLEDLQVDAIKIGMLYDENVINVVSDALDRYDTKYVVLDPVMIAKSGSELIKSKSIRLLEEKLLSKVTLITPNIPEAQTLVSRKLESLEDIESAATQLSETFNINVLIKGGHLESAQSSDFLYICANKERHWLHAERIKTQNTHGTGCTLSSAIAAYLALEYPLLEAVVLAKDYLRKAIISASTRKIGQGFSPVDHFFGLRDTVSLCNVL